MAKHSALSSSSRLHDLLTYLAGPAIMARLGWQGKLARTDFVALLRKNEADNGRRDLSFPQVLNVVVRSFAFF